MSLLIKGASQADVLALKEDVGDASAAALGSLYGILGDPAQTFLAMIGYEGAASLADKLTAARAAFIDYIGDPSGHTLTTLAVKWGDIARSLDLILGARWDVGGDLGTDVLTIINSLGALVDATGIFHEQADAGFSESITAAETFIVTLNAANTRYILRDLRVKSADPTAANSITVKLYTLINDGEVNVQSFIITNANFGTHFTLMDMFGVPYVAGDSIRVSLQGSAAGPYTVTGQYSHGKTNV